MRFLSFRNFYSSQEEAVPDRLKCKMRKLKMRIVLRPGTSATYSKTARTWEENKQTG